MVEVRFLPVAWFEFRLPIGVLFPLAVLRWESCIAVFDSVYLSVWRSYSLYLEVYREWFLETRVFCWWHFDLVFGFFCFRAGLVFLVSCLFLVSLVVCIGDLVRFVYPGVCPL